MNKTVLALMQKAGEYFMCAKHLNLRGASDVLNECGPIVDQLKSEGYTFEKLLKELDTENKYNIDVEKDIFLKNIRTMFEETCERK